MNVYQAYQHLATKRHLLKDQAVQTCRREYLRERRSNSMSLSVECRVDSSGNWYSFSYCCRASIDCCWNSAIFRRYASMRVDNRHADALGEPSFSPSTSYFIASLATDSLTVRPLLTLSYKREPGPYRASLYRDTGP